MLFRSTHTIPSRERTIKPSVMASCGQEKPSKGPGAGKERAVRRPVRWRKGSVLGRGGRLCRPRRARQALHPAPEALLQLGAPAGGGVGDWEGGRQSPGPVVSGFCASHPVPAGGTFLPAGEGGSLEQAPPGSWTVLLAYLAAPGEESQYQLQVRGGRGSSLKSLLRFSRIWV